MLPFCYEAGLASGHASDTPQLMSIATETFIKEILTQVFARTRSNGPGDSASAGYGVGTTWVQTHNYRRQLHREEDAAQRGELGRDKAGLLPIEARAAGERGALGIGDVRLSLEMADTGISHFPIITTSILYGYREGELDAWNDYTWLDGQDPSNHQVEEIHEANGISGLGLANGYADEMDIDEEIVWQGAENHDMDMLDGMLDSCLAVSS